MMMMMLRIAQRDGDDRYRLGVIAWAEGELCYSLPRCIFCTYCAGIDHIIVFAGGIFCCFG